MKRMKRITSQNKIICRENSNQQQYSIVMCWILKRKKITLKFKKFLNCSVLDCIDYFVVVINYFPPLRFYWKAPRLSSSKHDTPNLFLIYLNANRKKRRKRQKVKKKAERKPQKHIKPKHLSICRKSSTELNQLNNNPCLDACLDDSDRQWLSDMSHINLSKWNNRS